MFFLHLKPSLADNPFKTFSRIRGGCEISDYKKQATNQKAVTKLINYIYTKLPDTSEAP